MFSYIDMKERDKFALKATVLTMGILGIIVGAIVLISI